MSDAPPFTHPHTNTPTHHPYAHHPKSPPPSSKKVALARASGFVNDYTHNHNNSAAAAQPQLAGPLLEGEPTPAQRSYVDGSNVVSFVDLLADDEQGRRTRTDVLNIYLLAQLGADKAVPDANNNYALQQDWFLKYKETYSKFFTYQKWVSTRDKEIGGEPTGAKKTNTVEPLCAHHSRSAPLLAPPPPWRDATKTKQTGHQRVRSIGEPFHLAGGTARRAGWRRHHV